MIVSRDDHEGFPEFLRWGRMQFTARNAVCQAQMVLHSLLQKDWFPGWSKLLDTVDECVKVNVRSPFSFSFV